MIKGRDKEHSQQVEYYCNGHCHPTDAHTNYRETGQVHKDKYTQSKAVNLLALPAVNIGIKRNVIRQPVPDTGKSNFFRSNAKFFSIMLEHDRNIKVKSVKDRYSRCENQVKIFNF